MPITDRRTLLQAAAALPLATAGSAMALADAAPAAAPATAKPAPAKGITRVLAHYLVTAGYDDLPADVRKEGVRTLLNWVGVAIGGARPHTPGIPGAPPAPVSPPP